MINTIRKDDVTILTYLDLYKKKGLERY